MKRLTNGSAPALAGAGAVHPSGNGPLKRTGFWILGLLHRLGVS